MKKSSLLALSLVSLVSLVGCGKEPYAEEKGYVEKYSVAFYGEDAKDYIEAGDAVIYEGKDSSGKEVYAAGAIFDCLFFSTNAGVAAGDDPISIVDFMDTIAYQLDDNNNPIAPVISPLLVEDEFLNVTASMYSGAEDYIFDYGGEDFLLYAAAASNYVLSQLGGVYAKLVYDKNDEMIGAYILNVEVITVYFNEDDFDDLWGKETADSLKAADIYVDDDGNVTVAEASVTCQYESFENE